MALCAGKLAAQESPLDYRLWTGLRGGLNWADMRYSRAAMSLYDHTLVPHAMGGLFARVELGMDGLSLRPEVAFTGRGTQLEWADVKYRLSAHYLGFRLPLTYNFRLPSIPSLSPYLTVSPTVEVPTGGEIEYSAYDYPQGVSVDVSKANLSEYDIGVMVGVGIDWLTHVGSLPLILSFEAGYHWGLTNTFADREMADSYGVSPSDISVIANPFFGAELWKGSRHNSGIETAVRISVPFLLKKKAVPDTVVSLVSEIVRDTVYIREKSQPDTVYVREETRVDTVFKSGYVKKDCYSIAEIYSFITLGVDISDKRICLYNINFDFNSSTLRPESMKPLNEMVLLMNMFPEINIEVYGHTDSIGSEEYNMTLSENRANTVAQYLVSHGIAPERIYAIGFGLQYPIDSNETPEGRFRNRRVEIEVLNLKKN